jgi:hypothetical protein
MIALMIRLLQEMVRMQRLLVYYGRVRGFPKLASWGKERDKICATWSDGVYMVTVLLDADSLQEYIGGV